MPAFKLTKAAQADLRDIGRYTRKQWSQDQARTYLGQLDTCFHRLAENPQRGHPDPDIPLYTRVLQGSHVVFYRVIDNGIVLIVRVLHGRMLPTLHLQERDNEE